MMLKSAYLWSDKVAEQEWKHQHQSIYIVSSHFHTWVLVMIYLVEKGNLARPKPNYGFIWIEILESFL